MNLSKDWGQRLSKRTSSVNNHKLPDLEVYLANLTLVHIFRSTHVPIQMPPLQLIPASGLAPPGPLLFDCQVPPVILP
jgi:hypothetical protein